MLTKLELNNFKWFSRLDLPLAPLTLLAGLNNSGKSSVLQAIRMLRQYQAGILIRRKQHNLHAYLEHQFSIA